MEIFKVEKVSEFEKLYTVEDIARMTAFTSRTIRNYLKDGNLQGRKIGGQWRFTMDDIKKLFDNGKFLSESKRKNKQQVMDFLDGVDTGLQGQNRVCTVVDCDCENKIAGYRLYEKLVSVINHKDNGSPARFDYDYIETDNKARFTLFGNPDYIIKTLQQL